MIAEKGKTVKRQMRLSPSMNRKNVADDLRGILSRSGDAAVHHPTRWAVRSERRRDLRHYGVAVINLTAGECPLDTCIS